MKKAVLSNRILMSYTDELFEKVVNELTYQIPSKVPGEPPYFKRLYSKIGDRIISIPIGCIHLIPKDYEIVDKRVNNPVEFPQFKYTLRQSQQDIYDQIDDNCIINANVSFGKTFTGIAISTKLKQKTLVLVHTVYLRDQWVKEVEKTLGIAPGIIGSGKVDDKGPIVIANIQTFRKYINQYKETFGTVITDECHHCPSAMFEEALNKLKARYKIGLSATLGRKDQLHVVLTDYFGKKIYRPPRENQLKPEINVIQTSIPFTSNMMIPWATKVNELVGREDYFGLVTTLASMYADTGRKVLVLADRTEFLEKCYTKHEDKSVLIIGATKNRDEAVELLKEDDSINILYGAISIFKEGISINDLDTVILATPTNNEFMLEQIIGRILRKQEGKNTPIVVDILLAGTTAKRQAKTRIAHYANNGYDIKYIDLR